MKTTKEIRKIMRKHNISGFNIYTNKTRGDKSDNRRVKCYSRDPELINELNEFAGSRNVKVLINNDWRGCLTSIVVKCVLG